MQDIVDGYANAGIQLETVWNDIDCKNQVVFRIGLILKVHCRYGTI